MPFSSGRCSVDQIASINCISRYRIVRDQGGKVLSPADPYRLLWASADASCWRHWGWGPCCCTSRWLSSVPRYSPRCGPSGPHRGFSVPCSSARAGPGVAQLLDRDGQAQAVTGRAAAHAHGGTGHLPTARPADRADERRRARPASRAVAGPQRLRHRRPNGAIVLDEGLFGLLTADEMEALLVHNLPTSSAGTPWSRRWPTALHRHWWGWSASCCSRLSF